jgi:4-amino-4-deoxy-L-arabinose transferase-like glycosyltransferase
MNHTTNSGNRISHFLHRSDVLILVLLTVLALGLRLWRLDAVPPGWRDDELINSLVISQKVLDGKWALYYPDASGHEALYHILNAAMLGVFGPGLPGIRWLSVILGTMTVPLTYRVGKRLWNRPAGLVAATALTFNFWSLMYSRIGIRHILLPVLALPTFYFFWRGLETAETKVQIRDLRLPFRLDASFSPFLWAALFMGVGFYTYFAARGVPLILLAFCGYLGLFKRDSIKRRWRQLVLMFAVSALIALPLIVTLSRQPESEARVAELAVPLVEARAGNLDPLWTTSSFP